MKKKTRPSGTASVPADKLRHQRKDHEQPAATGERGWRYHHLGIPTVIPHPGEVFLKQFGCYVAGFSTSPYGIEWMRFEPWSPISDLIKTTPHIAFEVDDLDKELKGKTVLTAPNSPSGGVRVAMIVHDGAPIELIEFCRPNTRARRRSQRNAEK